MWHSMFPLLLALATAVGCSGNVVIDADENNASTSTSGDLVADVDASVFCDGYCKVVHDSEWSNCGDYRHCVHGCTLDIEHAVIAGCPDVGIAMYTCRAVAFGPDHDCSPKECEDERRAYHDCMDADASKD
jgi:hypothetical protein